ncbi:uncharacterized protein PpBr36_09645 [Pyricularia pennisetigena]|uniref:uncharacterized protein n=1 Tax=Pyricularia pennisetigena TaxID=1578925 RepID=UPI00114FEE84|nr:uncharacterized protein PpBr36_09645 [Pyricularia pennisetigena]TLS21638.1 hypothetical protein PpBr36_09645 [Pyricularia pennisetigena]
MLARTTALLVLGYLHGTFSAAVPAAVSNYADPTSSVFASHYPNKNEAPRLIPGLQPKKTAAKSTNTL